MRVFSLGRVFQSSVFLSPSHCHELLPRQTWNTLPVYLTTSIHLLIKSSLFFYMQLFLLLTPSTFRIITTYTHALSSHLVKMRNSSMPPSSSLPLFTETPLPTGRGWDMSQEYAHTKQSDGKTQSHKNGYASATSLILYMEAIIWLSKA